MAQIYDRPTKVLMTEWAKEHLVPGQTFGRAEPARWFAEHYSKIKRATVNMHVDGMSTNNPVRRHHGSIKPGSGHDLFFKLGPDLFRLWEPDKDPAPVYKSTLGKQTKSPELDVEETDEELTSPADREFAYERDLRNYLVKNLRLIEPGMQLYEDEGISGVEFQVGGRFVDILAVDKSDQYVVIELKVSRGYDRVIGQLLRYMAWVEKNVEPTKPVRGIIVAREITADLKLAASRIRDVKLVEYEISLKLKQV